MTADAPNNERRWVCEAPENVSPCTADDPHEWRGVDRCMFRPVDAAPVPSPVPPRPDTEKIRGQARLRADFWWPADYKRLNEACDWIDAHPVTNQGPDLSDLRAKRDEFEVWLNDGEDPSDDRVPARLLGQLLAAVDRLLADRGDS